MTHTYTLIYTYTRTSNAEDFAFIGSYEKDNGHQRLQLAISPLKNLQQRNPSAIKAGKTVNIKSIGIRVSLLNHKTFLTKFHAKKNKIYFFLVDVTAANQRGADKTQKSDNIERSKNLLKLHSKLDNGPLSTKQKSVVNGEKGTKMTLSLSKIKGILRAILLNLSKFPSLCKK